MTRRDLYRTYSWKLEVFLYLLVIDREPGQPGGVLCPLDLGDGLNVLSNFGFEMRVWDVPILHLTGLDSEFS